LVKRSDLKQYSLYGEEKWDGLVNIGKGIQLKAKIDVTRRGNGGLIIANLDLKVHDSNPALGLYEDSLLYIDLSDFNADGYRDLIISGRVLYYHEQRDEVLEKENVVFIYMFNPEKKQFKRCYKKASFDLTEGPSRVLKDTIQEREQEKKRREKKQ